MEIFERIRKQRGPLGQYAAMGEGYYMFPELKGEIGSRMDFHGKEVVVWSINNYLGLANHPEVRRVDAEAAKKWGLAYPMGARLMTGETSLHKELERKLAAYVYKEAAAVVNYGYPGVVSAIDALLSRRDAVVYDAESHGCIVDGTRLHMGERFSYKHNDIESVEQNLERATKWASEKGGGVLVVTEGVFGMRGDQGILKEIVALKKKFDFRFFVDDAHGFGTLGEGGRGAGVEQGVQDGIDVYFSTFAKSFAATGGFLAGDADIIQYLQYAMRSQIHAKSLPMALVEGNLKRLELMQNHPEYKEKLWHIATTLQNGLKARGFDIGTTNTVVTPVYLYGTPFEATQLVHDMRESYGVFTSMIIYPVIPKGMVLLRMIPTASHTDADVEQTLNAFSAVAEKLKAGAYQDKILNPVLG
ncbi:MAG: aminotransferase class I/II-fold pyridoxal phosphate-dependent enzyme [Saprospiraceae bacterium]|uniref:Aminotransferase class I/II-fold pyridoxal phosphate-dependent enzyme n=1 Tax=Candidatus Opimibacter skivensis TaxID=2982028 RepID=A0A9D7SY73_9BACT|nr:aminotransferase class I/II-fold pyridoxal phosphate-dependent enzyme [Candidatus Opimibacter skivensis]